MPPRSWPTWPWRFIDSRPIPPSIPPSRTPPSGCCSGLRPSWTPIRCSPWTCTPPAWPSGRPFRPGGESPGGGPRRSAAWTGRGGACASGRHRDRRVDGGPCDPGPGPGAGGAAPGSAPRGRSTFLAPSPASAPRLRRGAGPGGARGGGTVTGVLPPPPFGALGGAGRGQGCGSHGEGDEGSGSGAGEAAHVATWNRRSGPSAGDSRDSAIPGRTRSGPGPPTSWTPWRPTRSDAWSRGPGGSRGRALRHWPWRRTGRGSRLPRWFGSWTPPSRVGKGRSRPRCGDSSSGSPTARDGGLPRARDGRRRVPPWANRWSACSGPSRPGDLPGHAGRGLPGAATRGVGKRRRSRPPRPSASWNWPSVWTSRDPPWNRRSRPASCKGTWRRSWTWSKALPPIRKPPRAWRRFLFSPGAFRISFPVRMWTRGPSKGRGRPGRRCHRPALPATRRLGIPGRAAGRSSIVWWRWGPASPPGPWTTWLRMRGMSSATCWPSSSGSPSSPRAFPRCSTCTATMSGCAGRPWPWPSGRPGVGRRPWRSPSANEDERLVRMALLELRNGVPASVVPLLVDHLFGPDLHPSPPIPGRPRPGAESLAHGPGGAASRLWMEARGRRVRCRCPSRGAPPN
jgi:hypothetical protein